MGVFVCFISFIHSFIFSWLHMRRIVVYVSIEVASVALLHGSHDSFPTEIFLV